MAKDVPEAEIKGAEIKRLISDMKDTLSIAPDGVGLAAPQVGESLKIFLVSEEAEAIDARRKSVDPRPVVEEEREKKNWKHFVFINPVIVKQSRKKVNMVEGCLSVPGKFGSIPRTEKLALAWFDEDGKKHSRGFAGFFARVIQHEMDHLDGVLIVDRAKKIISVDSKPLH